MAIEGARGLGLIVKRLSWGEGARRVEGSYSSTSVLNDGAANKKVNTPCFTP